MEFVSNHKKTYVLSVLMAVMSVVCALLSYLFIGNIVKEVLVGNKNLTFYGEQCLDMALCWLGNVITHSISTALSHKATFQVLATIRRRLCEKLYRLPLGYITDMPSGGIKNVIVERVDSIETTLAHIVPEFTSNILCPVAVIIMLFIIDWRMALVSLITVPIGIFAYMGMMIGYEENFKNTIVKTKNLNNTAVEYINGIEVIKAFGKSENSYEKFVVAAKEGAA